METAATFGRHMLGQLVLEQAYISLSVLTKFAHLLGSIFIMYSSCCTMCPSQSGPNSAALVTISDTVGVQLITCDVGVE